MMEVESMKKKQIQRIKKGILAVVLSASMIFSNVGISSLEVIAAEETQEQETETKYSEVQEPETQDSEVQQPETQDYEVQQQ